MHSSGTRPSLTVDCGSFGNDKTMAIDGDAMRLHEQSALSAISRAVNTKTGSTTRAAAKPFDCLLGLLRSSCRNSSEPPPRLRTSALKKVKAVVISTTRPDKSDSCRRVRLASELAGLGFVIRINRHQAAAL